VGWVLPDGSMRRLTTLEHERLQGFPDDYTDVPCPGAGRKVGTRKMRERALGNSFSPVILYWLGRRIDYLIRLGHDGRTCCKDCWLPRRPVLGGPGQ
jgi:DNA (cytosine-5)-methyltransferase 1